MSSYARPEWTAWHERHANKIELIAGIDCWIWLGATGAGGYGRVKYGKGTEGAHKAAFLEAGGNFSNGPLVRHLCGNRYCVRPGHLAAGTKADNARDTSIMFQTTSWLTEKDVIAIRLAYRDGKSLGDIARAHHIAYGSVFPIVCGKSFRHIAPELITAKGARQPPKLSMQDVADIREALLLGEQSQSAIARDFSVKQSQISRIKTGARHRAKDHTYTAATQDKLGV